jgi:acetyl-CoA carboxylase biotin carboxyl carrier protein
MDFNQIQELIRMVSKHKLAELKLEQEDFRLVIRNQSGAEAPIVSTPVVIPAAPPVVAVAPPAAAPAPAENPAAAPASPAAAPAAENNAGFVTIKSPMVGTFYRSPSPDKGAFVKVGDTVDAGTTVCIIEAMKLFNEIESDVKGKIVKVLVEDATPVEYDQPLFLVDPA